MRLVFHLLYTQYGGSGLQLSYTEIMGMELGEIVWWVERLGETREAESEAIKNSRRSGG